MAGGGLSRRSAVRLGMRWAGGKDLEKGGYM